VVFLYKLNLFLNFSGDSFERTAWKFSKPSNEKLNLAPEVSPQPIFIIFSLLLLSLGKYLVVHYKRQDGCGAVFCSHVARTCRTVGQRMLRKRILDFAGQFTL